MADYCLSRRRTLALGLGGLAVGSLAVPSTASVGLSPQTKLFEHAFLKAKAGLRAELSQFVIANWYPMDQRGVDQGIFTSYWLLEEAGTNAAWDFVMVVGYPTELGYGEPRAVELFSEIRRNHAEVKIGGKGLKDLGDIVGHNRLKII